LEVGLAANILVIVGNFANPQSPDFGRWRFDKYRKVTNLEKLDE
jgi:hypothetical protein